MNDALRWARTIGWAAGDPTRRALGWASPLATALAFRGTARWWLGRPGWREDLDEALAIARGGDASTVGFITAWVYGNAVLNGVLWVDDSAPSTTSSGRYKSPKHRAMTMSSAASRSRSGPR